MEHVAAAVVRAARGHDSAEVAQRLKTLIVDSDSGMADARSVVSILLHGAAAMAQELSWAEAGTLEIQLKVHDQNGRPIAIDDADPPLRTVARALLAEVHGDRETADVHVDIAFEAAPAEQLTVVVLHAIYWTAEFSNECQRRNLPMPSWLAPDGDLD